MRKLFLLEDDLSLISGLTFAFKKQGFALDTARTLAEAEVLWSDRKYDLLVLDVSLPDGSGFDFCQKVRRTSNVPILFLTASDEEMNIIMGLELGGDDYLTKPFKLGVLLSRVNALLRRANASSAGEPVLESGSMVQIKVRDNGSGIHPEDLYHIFKRFYRSRFSQDTQGIGLGLPLAKAVVEAHHGTIEVDSELGKGTTFTLNFPIPTKL